MTHILTTRAQPRDTSGVGTDMEMLRLRFGPCRMRGRCEVERYERNRPHRHRGTYSTIRASPKSAKSRETRADTRHESRPAAARRPQSVPAAVRPGFPHAASNVCGTVGALARKRLGAREGDTKRDTKRNISPVWLWVTPHAHSWRGVWCPYG